MESKNPYDTPTGNLDSGDDDVGEILFLSAGCRIGRLRYLSHSLLFLFLLYILIAIVGAVAAVVFSDSNTPAIVIGILAVVAIIFYIYVSYILIIQRLHDLNQSGWLCLLTFVPLANIFLTIWILFFPGTKGSNNYGNRPPPNKAWNWIVALGLPILFGILAAIAVPAYLDYMERAKASMPLHQTE